jgi:hypothetical protein
MLRECAHCGRAFTPKDLLKEDSKNMEADRKALGLVGVRFLYYRCPECNFADIFVDIHALPDETPEAFSRRRRELEDTVKQISATNCEVIVCERH